MKAVMPSISSYGQYSSGNYGVHTQRVDIGDLTLWFSYKTLVAFQFTGKGRTVTRNYWSTTTGKHLNWIDGGNKANRVDAETFAEKWKEMAESCNLDPASVTV
jgi:hypothetical protein